MQDEQRKALFVDDEGREWKLRFDLGLCEDLRDTIGFDFDDLQAGSGFLSMGQDLKKYGALLWMLCEKQADGLGIEPKDFRNAIGPGAIDSSLIAIKEAVINFTRVQHREGVAEVLKQATNAEQKGGDLLREMAAAAEQEMEAELRKAVDQRKDSGLSLPAGGR